MMSSVTCFESRTSTFFVKTSTSDKGASDFLSISVATTSAGSWLNFKAQALPSPLPAPVITIVLFFTLTFFLKNSLTVPKKNFVSTDLIAGMITLTGSFFRLLPGQAGILGTI